MAIPGIVWLAALIILLVVEAVTVGLVCLWFAAGALCALIVSFFTESVWVQLTVFLAVSLVCLLALRPLAKKYMDPRRVPTNADRVVGAEGVVTESIDNLKAQGQVSVAGAPWTARTEPDAPPISAGTAVRVLRIEGVKVIVTPLPAGAAQAADRS